MNTNKIDNISQAISDIIIPKLEKYIEDRKNDVSLLDKIEAIVDKIDDYETLVNELVTNELEDNFKERIEIGGYGFTYEETLNAHIFNGNKLYRAKNDVWEQEGLDYYWRYSERINNRITAIVSTLEETSFDQIVKIVESQIDFNEFIVRPVNNDIRILVQPLKCTTE